VLSRLTAALVAAGLLLLTACAQQTLGPEEIHQRQQEITTEVAQKYGFPDVSVSIISAGKTAPPTILEGEIVEQQVSVRIGNIRQPSDARKTCYRVVVWRLRSPPDLMEDSANMVLIQADTSYEKVERNKDILGLADCFTP